MNHLHFKNVHGWYLNIILYKCIKNDFANLVNNCFHFQKNQLSKLFTLRELPDSFFSNVHENITIVTAYWDLGTFRKGKKKAAYKASLWKVGINFWNDIKPCDCVYRFKCFSIQYGKLQIKIYKQNNDILC